MASIKGKIIKNTIANYANKIIAIAINLIMLPFIVFHIGAVEYGVYLFIGAITGYFGLLDLGVGTSTVKYVAEHHTRKDKEKLNQTFNASFFFFLAIGLIIAFSLLIIGELLIGALGFPSDLYWKAKALVYLMAIGSISSWCLGTFKHVLGGLQRYDLSALITIVTSLTTAGATAAVLLMGYGIVEMVLWGLVIGTIGGGIASVVVAKLIPYLEIRLRYIRKDSVKQIFMFSSVVFIIDICGMIMIQTDRILIGIFVTMGAITLYAVAAALHGIIKNVSGLASSALLPAATELNTLKEEKKLKKLILRGGKYKCALILPFLVFIMIMAKPIIEVWMGDAFLGAAVITQVFVLYWFLFALWGVLGTVLLAVEKFKLILWLNVSLTIINFIVSVILVQVYGVMGVVIGTSIPYIFIMPVFLIYGLRILEVDWKEYFKETFLKTYPQAGLLSVVLVILYIWAYPSGIIILGLYGIMTLALYYGLFYQFGLNSLEKRELTDRLRNLRKSLRTG
jgi:O-antigen/teichoic acid export membrane protein